MTRNGFLGPAGPAAARYNFHTRVGSPAWQRVGFCYPSCTVPQVELEIDCHCRECERQRIHLARECVGPKCNQPIIRYPLYGREIDWGRAQWEYFAQDTENDVRVPVGVPRGVNQLCNGDVVVLQGDPREFIVAINELDDRFNYAQLGYDLPPARPRFPY